MNTSSSHIQELVTHIFQFLDVLPGQRAARAELVGWVQHDSPHLRLQREEVMTGCYTFTTGQRVSKVCTVNQKHRKMCESRPNQHSGSGSLTMTATKVSDTTCPLMVHSSWIPRKMRLMRLSSWMRYISLLRAAAAAAVISTTVKSDKPGRTLQGCKMRTQSVGIRMPWQRCHSTV